ncbi:metal-dependent hydrolase [Fulvivirga maritima]|uniref:metal-dependent hydrolase n=1 Tax=Fulvivirga maritima TaxID=2904247 RepID=UPI001F2D767E|nr:metal-dependent hydrolase [Fulvivirga maritima]UII27919.1 metal-dependent hydrolase [Fulvivirga maritima]
MKVTYYGHACFSVEVKGKNLLFDPFITPNEKAKAIDINAIKADYILISHGHQDHLADAVAIAKNTGATVVSNFEIITWAQNQGVENVHPMNHGGYVEFDFGKVKYVNAIHSSSFADGSYAGNPGGFVVASDEKNFYYAGDTALTMDMKLIPAFAKIDFAVLPIGNCLTMGVEDAITAADFVECNKVLGVHYDTMPIITIDHQASIDQFKASDKELVLMEIGESKDF